MLISGVPKGFKSRGAFAVAGSVGVVDSLPPHTHRGAL